jgi:S-DNA-T family DNA segregation ATPase FtsK/SpoIIIE
MGGYKRIIGAIALILICAYIFLAIFSYNVYQNTPNSYTIAVLHQTNLGGYIGSFISNPLLQIFGLGSFLLIFIILILGINLIVQRRLNLRFFTGIAIFFITFLVFINLLWPKFIYNGDNISSGGLIGQGLLFWLHRWFGEVGVIVIIILSFVVSSVLIVKKEGVKRFLNIIRGVITLIKKSELRVKEIGKIFAMFTSFGSNIKLKIEKKKGLRKRHRAFISNKELFGEKDEDIIKSNIKTEPSGLKEKETYFDFIEDRQNKIPPISILPFKAADFPQKLSKPSFLINARLIEKKLLDLGISGKVNGINPGPIITMYEFEPASGIKVGKIQSLSEDLTMALKSKSVRIAGVIEGKSAIGIEVPNNNRETVYFSEILNSKEFAESNSPLTIILGKGTTGENVIFDLAKCPHLLVAGSTGAGKSIFLNTLITSILFKAAYDEVNFIMIDPKRLELTAYEKLPHLATDVIYDPKTASSALNWAVQEMGLRYKIMQEASVKNIEQYNEYLKKEKMKPIPYLVIIIDELSDLMLASPKTIEMSIIRLSQMARACGIHLVIATQRPSVNVITGVIKANMPSRIAFLVSSKVDSRTILDANGAEELLGSGDMLFMPPGQGRLLRIHGGYISEEEIKNVIGFINEKNFPSQKSENLINEFEKENNFDKITENDSDDEIYNQVLDMVKDMEAVSISFIQRRFRIGFNRAARIFERLQAGGILTKKGRVLK